MMATTTMTTTATIMTTMSTMIICEQWWRAGGRFSWNIWPNHHFLFLNIHNEYSKICIQYIVCTAAYGVRASARIYESLLLGGIMRHAKSNVWHWLNIFCFGPITWYKASLIVVVSTRHLSSVWTILKKRPKLLMSFPKHEFLMIFKWFDLPVWCWCSRASISHLVIIYCTRLPQQWFHK